jgi:hypothetical protein
MAVGKRDPGCFSDPFDPAYIGKLKARNAFQLGELHTLIAYAENKGITEPWVDILSQRLKLLRYRRHLISGIERLGLREPIFHALNFFDRLTQGRPRGAAPQSDAQRRAEVLNHGAVVANAGLGLAWPVTPSSEGLSPPVPRDHVKR